MERPLIYQKKYIKHCYHIDRTSKLSVTLPHRMSRDIPDELGHHHGDKCSYACWSTESREVSNAVAYDMKPNSRWARESYQVDLLAGVILGCDCDDDGICKHIEHVITMDTRGCVEYNPDIDSDRVRELKAFTHSRRKELYSKIRTAQ